MHMRRNDFSMMMMIMEPHNNNDFTFNFNRNGNNLDGNRGMNHEGSGLGFHKVDWEGQHGLYCSSSGSGQNHNHNHNYGESGDGGVMMYEGPAPLIEDWTLFPGEGAVAASGGDQQALGGPEIEFNESWNQEAEGLEESETVNIMSRQVVATFDAQPPYPQYVEPILNQGYNNNNFIGSSSSSTSTSGVGFIGNTNLKAESSGFLIPPPTIMTPVPITTPAPVSSNVAALSRKRSHSSSLRSWSSDESWSDADQSTGTKSSSTANPNRKRRRTWSQKEDEKLLQLIEKYGLKQWKKLAEHMPGKSGNQCSQRWFKALDPSIKRGKWDPEEDENLANAVETHGQNWKVVSKLIPGRTGKQCRDRYIAKLNPKLKHGKWTKEEEEQALQAYEKFGNRWALIQKTMPQRNWYTIKWKIETLLRKKS